MVCFLHRKKKEGYLYEGNFRRTTMKRLKGLKRPNTQIKKMYFLA